jgi:hypothetical protein
MMGDLNTLMSQARDTTDPLERARLLNEEVLPALTSFRQVVIAERALSVKEACDFGNGGDGLTYSQIARDMGVSKPLVQQMVALARKIHAERMKRRVVG